MGVFANKYLEYLLVVMRHFLLTYTYGGDIAVWLM